MSSVQSVRRAFSVLQSLALGPAGVTEIAVRTELPKSTVARLLSTLVEVGAVEQNEDLGVYSIGETIADLSSSVSLGQNLVQLARPYLVELVEEIGEAVGLGTLEGHEVYYYDQVDSEHEVQVRNWAGESISAHVVSSGTVLLAHVDETARSTFLSLPLERWTPNSVIDPALIARRLDEAKAQGFAWTFEEMSEGLNSVAAPIFNAAGDAVAAIHAHGPSYRFPQKGQERAVANAVVKTAGRISKRLAGRHL
ncbi:IclR family transcriptional regulator [Actibacterium pelagium]|uniref:IclR family transcriptional regulator n=1 Tax=Actibacterium pelagium TaxID=2029103 RepID=A0A917AMC5_9RHOB|nr:IclR family transcriptional regulator [Actibacterium pelagium]GGE61799.1 IclR family transcriptional regulator [Actibacterium pelagium]